MRPISEGTLRGPAPRGARKLARRLLQQADSVAPRIVDKADEEAVHDFRVAVRRLRSVLRAYRRRLPEKHVAQPRRALNRLARATGATRDYEVKIEWIKTLRRELPPQQRKDADWLLERLTRRLDDSAAVMQADVSDQFAKVSGQLSGALKKSAKQKQKSVPTFGQAVGELILSHCDDLRRHTKRVQSPRDIEEAHQARIEVKRIRYLLEPLGSTLPGTKDVISRLKRIQTLLGDFNDMAVLGRELLRAAEHDALCRAEHTWDTAVHADGDAKTLREALRHARPRTGLFRLGQIVKRRGLELFQAISVEKDLPRLIKDIEKLGRKLVDRYTAEREIERKFLLRAVPRVARERDVIEIEQGYLPGKLRERLRRERQNGSTRYVRTVKKGQGIERVQFEEETSRKAFDVDWPATEGHRVLKRRYVVLHEDLTWEIDEFIDRDLVIAEVELPSQDTAAPLPPWLRPYVLREVTDESQYSNINLAC